MTRKAEEAFEHPEVTAASPALDRDVIVAAVERYLAKRQSDRKPTVPDPPAKRVEEPPKSPAIDVVDFVCESDVRAAVTQSKKIYIGANTIVTPSARDLSLQYDVLVMTDRKQVLKKNASE
jgi:hypothetical protein